MPIQFSPSFEFSAEQVKGYHDSPTGNKALADRILGSGFFANAATVLDIGCGDGRLTALFAKQLPTASVIGCDVSKAMIEYAVTHYTSSNLRFMEMNAEDLRFPQQFDRIGSFHCLHWIKNQERVFEQIFKVLKVGGKALLIATPESSNNDFKTVCTKLILSFRWLPYFFTLRPIHSFYTQKEYEKMLTTAGFSVDKIEIQPTELIFQDKSELEPFLRAILTPLQHLDPKHRPAFLEDFFQELVKQGRVDAQGRIHIVFDEIELHVSKKEKITGWQDGQDKG